MMVKIIIAAYFLGVLIIGLVSYFGIKTPADYYVAGKKAGTTAVAGSLLATILGGSAILGTIELSWNIGWPAIWLLFSAALGLIALVPLSKYVKRFGNYTLPEMLGKFYGKNAEIISSVIIPIAWTGVVAAQIIASAKIISELDFTSYNQGVLLSGSVFIIYTLFGGQLSILKTDRVQALIIIAGLIALVVFSMLKSDQIKIPTFTLNSVFNASFSIVDLIILILTYSVTFVVGPDIYSRIFCAKSEKTARQSIIIVALILIPISFALTWLGIFSKDSGLGITGFAAHLLPEWGYGLFIAALLSALMSSADTTLLTSSIILSELTGINMDEKSALKRTRLFIIAVGASGILISMFITSIVQALLFGLAVFSGAFVIPVFAGLLQLKVIKSRVVPAIITGGLVALAGKGIHDFQSEQIGNILSISAYVISSILLFVSFRRN
ncbi:MAG: sodium:solute symporter family protein [Prolixibacteraceae bacterium]|nr:sodium:solute symporter family protein [Prolixibacteraceae bacterium]